MIIPIAKPNFLHEYWYNYLQEKHEIFFNTKLKNPDQHWWFIDFNTLAKDVAGFAGMKLSPKNPVCMQMGPCAVYDKYRGRGIQRLLLKEREREAAEIGCTLSVSYTDIRNNASSNNFIRAGYLLTKPWSDIQPNDEYLFWSRQLP